MKKIIVLFLLLIFAVPVFASQWFQIFEKQSIDMESINTYGKQNIIKFWVKAEPKDKTQKYLDKEYSYVLSYFALSCKDKKSRIESIIIYDKNLKILHSDNDVPNWENIIPDTYSDGYYKAFCLIPFKKNPLLKH